MDGRDVRRKVPCRGLPCAAGVLPPLLPELPAGPAQAMGTQVSSCTDRGDRNAGKLHCSGLLHRLPAPLHPGTEAATPVLPVLELPPGQAGSVALRPWKRCSRCSGSFICFSSSRRRAAA